MAQPVLVMRSINNAVEDHGDLARLGPFRQQLAAAEAGKESAFLYDSLRGLWNRRAGVCPPQIDVDDEDIGRVAGDPRELVDELGLGVQHLDRSREGLPQVGGGLLGLERIVFEQEDLDL